MKATRASYAIRCDPLSHLMVYSILYLVQVSLLYGGNKYYRDICSKWICIEIVPIEPTLVSPRHIVAIKIFPWLFLRLAIPTRPTVFSLAFALSRKDMNC